MMKKTSEMNITWTEFPDTLRSGDSISCDIDGTTVSAIVSFSDKDISVVSESPKSGLRGSSHIMFMAPYTFRNSDGTGNCHAVKSARKILPELWDGYLRLLALAPSVSEGLERYNEEHDRLEGEILALRERKAGMKRALKAGTLDNRTYQRKLSPVIDGIEQLKRQQWDLFENMFHLDARCGYSLANKMEILRSITGIEIK